MAYITEERMHDLRRLLQQHLSEQEILEFTPGPIVGCELDDLSWHIVTRIVAGKKFSAIADELYRLQPKVSYSITEKFAEAVEVNGCADSADLLVRFIEQHLQSTFTERLAKEAFTILIHWLHRRGEQQEAVRALLLAWIDPRHAQTTVAKLVEPLDLTVREGQLLMYQIRRVLKRHKQSTYMVRAVVRLAVAYERRNNDQLPASHLRILSGNPMDPE